MRRGWLVTATALTVLTACTDTPQPPPPLTQSPSTTTPSDPAPPKAPPVPSPLNASAFENDPCLSLTEPQQKQFGLDSGKVREVAIEGKSCFYRFPDPKASAVSVTYASKTPNGLSLRYIQQAQGWYGYWEPADVGGHPGVGYDPSVDLAMCSFAIGLTDSLYFWVTAPEKAGTSRCSTAKEVATAVLTTIKSGR